MEFKYYSSILKKDTSLAVLVVAMFFILLLVPSGLVGGATWDNHRFIFLSLVPIFYFCKSIFEVSLPRLILSDFSWFFFLLLVFFSFFWATDRTLVWNQGFGWTGLLLWMIILRTYCINTQINEFFADIFLLIALIINVYIALIIITGRLNEAREWNMYFGYDNNQNYVATYLASLYPFLLYHKCKVKYFKVIKILGTLLLCYVLMISNALGAIIASLIIFCVFLMRKIPKFRLKKIGFYFSAFLLIVFFILYNFSNVIAEIIPTVEKLKEFERTRTFMITQSFRIFGENPILGIGVGNWHIEAYKYILSDVPPFNYPNNYDYLRNHNYFSQQLAELGILGVIAFWCPLSKVLYRGFSRLKKLSSLQLASFSALLVYLFSSLIYCTANFFEFRFSGIQFIAFCSLGFLTKDYKQISKLTKNFNFFLFILSIISLFWFVYNKHSFEVYQNAKEIASKNSKKAIGLLEKLYNPTFKTTNYYNNSIAYDLAKLHEKNANEEEAEFYYEKALKNFPNDKKNLIDYSRFLIREKDNPSKAKFLVNRLYEFQDNFFDANILLAEIATLELNYEVARLHLDKIYHGGYLYRAWLIEQQLYYSEYLTELVGLSTQQEASLQILEEENRKSIAEFKKEMALLEWANKEGNLDEKITKLRKTIGEDMFLQEKQLVQLLTEKQFQVYLGDRWKGRFNYLLEGLDYLIDLKEDQKKSILPLIREFEINRKIVELKLNIPKIRRNQELLNTLVIKRDSLPLALISGLALKITDKQLDIYLSDYVGKKFSYQLNQIKQISLNLDKSEISNLERAFYEYRINVILLQIGKQKRNRTINEELVFLRNTFYKSIKEIFSSPQLNEIKELFMNE